MNARFGMAHRLADICNFLALCNTDGDPDGVKVSSRELNHVVWQQAVNKTPGYDIIDGVVAKIICQYFPNLLKKRFTKCLLLRHSPTDWKNLTVLFFKKRNENPDSFRAYRPITLLPILGKLLERIMKLKTITNLESEGFLVQSQYGFREGRRTVHALKKLKRSVRVILFD